MDEHIDRVGIDLKDAFLPTPKTNGAHPPRVARATNSRPTRKEAEAAVKTLILWAGDDPLRPGLSGTPARVVRVSGVRPLFYYLNSLGGAARPRNLSGPVIEPSKV